jgi:hypothetical protein
VNDIQKEAVSFIAQSLHDFSQTLPPSARKPFIDAANAHIMTMQESIRAATPHDGD